MIKGGLLRFFGIIMINMLIVSKKMLNFVAGLTPSVFRERKRGGRKIKIKGVYPRFISWHI